MYEVFTRLLNMSFTASVLVLFIIILRFLFKKVPKKYICVLWALVAVRLICPFGFSSVISAYNMLHQNTISKGQVEYFEYNQKTEKPELTFVLPALVSDIDSPDSMIIGTKSVDVYMPSVVYIWLFGALVMILYAVVGYAKLRKEVRASINKEGKIYVCDEINAPFIFGILKPRIYLPSGINGEVYEHVVAHERAHIKRLDYIWKPLGFILLSIYWFQPVIWIAYIFLCKDIEAACDEKVISNMDKESIAGYSQALLECASQRRMITVCPVAFGETDVKGRIRNVLNYKKPAFWVICISILACIVVAACFLTNPKENQEIPDNAEETLLDTAIQETAKQQDADAQEIAEQPDVNAQETMGILDKISYSEYTYELIFNFGGKFFLSEEFREPLHGDYVPKGWYMLGGEGECIDPSFSERETFKDGKLIAYDWLDNHSSCQAIKTFTVDEYSCCLYQYSFGLFTAPDLEKYPVNDPNSRYWVIFYTEGEGKPLYIKYFNSDYFTQEQAMENI